MSVQKDDKSTGCQLMSAPHPKTLAELMDVVPDFAETVAKFAITTTLPIIDPVAPKLHFCMHSHARLPPPPEARVLQTRGPDPWMGGFLDRSMDEVAGKATKALYGWSGHCSQQEINTAILATSRKFNSMAMKHLHVNNTVMFTNPDAMRCFSEKFPAAAAAIVKVVLVMEIEQTDGYLIASAHRDLQNYPMAHANVNGPWLSKLRRHPLFMTDLDMTCPVGGPRLQLSQRFPSLNNLTLFFVNWKQKEVLDIDGMEAPVSGSGMDDLGGITEWMYHFEINPIVDFMTRVSRPVRMVRDADLVGWIQELALAGWQVPEPRIAGMEEMADQDLVRYCEAILKRE